MISMQIRGEHRGDWHDSLYNCFSQILPSCFLSFLCPCVLLGQIAEAVQFGPCICICSAYCSLTFIAILLIFISYQGIFFVWGILATFLFVIRVNVRRYNSLKIDHLSDIVAVCCCSWCTISQVPLVSSQLLPSPISLPLLFFQMARHVFRYRSRFEGLPCATDGRPTHSNHHTSTVVPIATALPYPMADATHQSHQIQYIQHPPRRPPPAPVIVSATRIPRSQLRQSSLQQQYQQQEFLYDSQGNAIPVATVVAHIV
jgi:Cys-rich protein (TIGR01571 family)